MLSKTTTLDVLKQVEEKTLTLTMGPAMSLGTVTVVRVIRAYGAGGVVETRVGDAGIFDFCCRHIARKQLT